MIRTIEIRVDTSYGTASLLPGLPAAATWDCNVDLTLLLIGNLTTPPRFKGLSLSNYWAWIRYGIAMNPIGDLRLRRIWRDIDSHQKTILSDDFGVGFPCHYLVDNHGFEAFADTKYLVEHLLKGFVSLLGSDSRGPLKSPDFIAVDNLGRLHIIECKGTQSSREALKKAIGRGIAQKNNLSNPWLFTSCMVGGIFVPQHQSKEAAEIVFADPPADEILRALAELGRPALRKGVRRISLAKTLSMAGLWTAASAITDERVNPDNVSFVRNLAKGELTFAGYSKDSATGNWKRKIEFRSLDEDTEETGRKTPVITTLTVVLPSTIEDLFADAVSDDGSVSRTKVDKWIAARRRDTRVRRIAEEVEVVTQDGQRPPARGNVRRSFNTSWSKVGLGGPNADNSSARGWQTESSVQFMFERAEIVNG